MNGDGEKTHIMLLDSLRESFRCTGCGKNFMEAFNSSCEHFFCRDCFYSINIAIGRCLVCSAPCIDKNGSLEPLLTDMAKAFDRFDRYLGRTPEQRSRLIEPYAYRKVEEREKRTSQFSQGEESVDLLATMNPQPTASPLDHIREIDADVGHINVEEVSLEGFADVKKRGSRKRRFLDESFDETFVSPTTEHHRLPPLFDSKHHIHPNSTEEQSKELLANKSVSFSSMSYPNSSRIFATGDSQVPITQNSQFDRMISDIDKIKRNIEQMLDEASFVQSPQTNSADFPAKVVPQIDTAEFFVSSPKKTSSVQKPQEQYTSDKDSASDEFSVVSQELIPLSPITSPTQTIVEIQPFYSQGNELGPREDEDGKSSQDLMLTMALDSNSTGALPNNNSLQHSCNGSMRSNMSTLGTSRSASFTAALRNFTAESDDRKVYVVTAVHSTSQQRILYQTALSKGWILDATSVEKLTAERLVVNVLVSEQTKRQDGMRLTLRTTSYMKALLLGYLIVDYSWLEACIADDRLRDPYEFELTGTIFDRSFRSPLRSRFLPRKPNGAIQLLEDFSFYIIDGGDLPPPLCCTSDVEEMIRGAGGLLVDEKISLRSISSKSLPLLLKLKSKAGHNGRSSEGDLANFAVSVSWLFESICNLRTPFDATEYLLALPE